MDVSVVISTYNRGQMLKDTLQGILASGRGVAFEWEIVVVDNNSHDDTRVIVEKLSEREPRVRYVFEPKQGASIGRNTGLEYSKGKILLFTDDDVLVGDDWLKVGYEGFGGADVAFIMGRILPLWTVPKPDWVPDGLTGPIGVCDLGESVIKVAEGSPHLPMTANLGVRREVPLRVGGFDANLGPQGRHSSGASRRGYFSGEDYEFGLRMIEAGYRGMYLPGLVVHNRINAERLTKAYFRGRMFANGQAYSIIGRGRDHRFRRLGGVPRYLFREAARDATRWATCVMRGRTAAAFRHELQLRAFLGFLYDRWRLPVGCAVHRGGGPE